MLCKNRKWNSRFPGKLLLSRREVSSWDTGIYNKINKIITGIHIFWFTLQEKILIDSDDLVILWSLEFVLLWAHLRFWPKNEGIRLHEVSLCRSLPGDMFSHDTHGHAMPLKHITDTRVPLLWQMQHGVDSYILVAALGMHIRYHKLYWWVLISYV